MKISPFARALFATTATMLFLSCATSPVATSPKPPPTKEKAIVAVRKGSKLQLAGDKARFVKAMQQAFEKVKQKEAVTDVSIYSTPKSNYLAVRLEDPRKNRSTLFIDLRPVDEGSAFHTVGPHVVTCVNNNDCKKNCIVLDPYSAGNNTPSPACECVGDAIGSHTCNFKINKVYIGELVAVFKDIVRQL